MGCNGAMIAVILVAGMGKRLMPLTKDIPKTLLMIGGNTILEDIIKKCVSNSVKKFVIVVGHKKERVVKACKNLQIENEIDFCLVENKKYSETNTAYSLLLALDRVGHVDDVLLINGDDIFDKEILTNLLKTPHTSLAIDNIKELDNESFKIDLDRSIIKDMGKELDIKKSSGEFIGISKIANEDIALLKKILIKLIKSNLQQYYDIAFKELSKETSLDFVYTNGLKWTEVDTYNDLDYAKKLIVELVD